MSETDNGTNESLFRLGERRCVLVLILLFIAISISIAIIPYDPSVDLADATTNDIWIEYYSKGVYHIPYSEWESGQTQSVVVNYSGQYVVVNEKGPGHIVMMLPFHVLGVEFLFEPLMVGFAVLSTYMLGKRLVNWRVGFIASALVLCNATVLVMWYRYYWTDASTMHLLILSVWLLVESNYWLNGRSLDPRNKSCSSSKQRLAAIMLGVLSGLSFGMSVATRYATALVIFALLCYILTFYLVRSWPDIRSGRILVAIRTTSRMWILLVTFLLGLMVVLIPLTQYNSEYFGGPFNSGYDETLLSQFIEDNETLTDRDTSESWASGTDSMVSTAFGNLMVLAPVLISRMPGLILFPVALWLVRRKLILWFMPLWIAITLFTYLSISWVDMYATMPAGNLHEPRYWMPAVPPVAIMAGMALDKMVPWLVKRLHQSSGRDREPLLFCRRNLTAAIVVILMLWGMVPAAIYLSNVGPDGALSPVSQGPPNPHPLPQLSVIAQLQLIRDEVVLCPFSISLLQNHAIWHDLPILFSVIGDFHLESSIIAR